MENLTVIYLTENRLPKYWTEYHQKILLEAVGKLPLITVSRNPMQIGLNLMQTEPRSPSNVYWQILKAAKIATTDYIGIAEDDTLYPPEHFKHRPAKGRVGYNMNHWSLFTWEYRFDPRPIYSWRNRRGNYSMIAERELVIEALEERFAKYPGGTPDKITGEIGRHLVERNIGITLRDVEEFWTSISLVNFNHDFGMDDLQIRHQKGLGTLRSYDIPHWGRADELVKHFR